MTQRGAESLAGRRFVVYPAGNPAQEVPQDGERIDAPLQYEEDGKIWRQSMSMSEAGPHGGQRHTQIIFQQQDHHREGGRRTNCPGGDGED